MTRTVPAVLSVMLLLVGQPAVSGDVAIEALKIQNEGFAKDGGKAGKGDADRPLIIGSPPNPGKKGGPTAANEVTHTNQQGSAKFVPEKDDQVIVGFEQGQPKGKAGSGVGGGLPDDANLKR